MSSDKPYDGPFIVHSTPPNATEPYKGSSPIIHPTQLEPYNDEPIYLPETSTSPAEVSLQPPCQEIDFLGISIGISRGIEGLNCTEWTVLLDRLDTGTNPETESPNVCRAYTIDSGPKDGFNEEYNKHIRIDKPFHSLGASNNNSSSSSSSSSSAYEILIPCGILHRDFLPLFDRIFWVTRSGPNNYFILRFLRMLGAYGLVCEGDVLMALEYLGLEKRYNAMEIECFKGLLTAEDYNYVLGFTDYPFGYQVFF